MFKQISRKSRKTLLSLKNTTNIEPSGWDQKQNGEDIGISAWENRILDITQSERRYKKP